MKTLVTPENPTSPTWRTVPAGLALFLAACSSGGGGAPEAATPAVATPALPAPASGHYAFAGASAAAIRYGDTRSGRDSVLFVTSGSATVTAASSRGRYVVVAHPRADSMILSLIALSDGAVRRLLAVSPSAELSLVWAPDGARLAMGVRGGASAGVFVADTAGQVRNLGCSAANQVEAFRGSDQLIVSDGANFYAVSVPGCQTLATFPGRGKSDVRYAPNGRHVTFMRDHQTAGRPELWVAEYNGNGAKVITSYNFQPTGVRWSPDGRRLAFTVQSQQYRNVTHVATYDIQSGDAQIGRDETPLGVPRDFDPCWSPDGSRYAFSRSYQRSGADGQSYETRQAVVRTVGSAASRVLSEDLVRGATDGGGRCQWVGDAHVLVRSPVGNKVVNVTTDAVYDLPAWRDVFGVLVR